MPQQQFGEAAEIHFAAKQSDLFVSCRFLFFFFL